MRKLFLLSVLFCSCKIHKPVASSGLITYKVLSVEKLRSGSVVTLQGVKGQFIVPSDTLKVNDAITVSWLHKK